MSGQRRYLDLNVYLRNSGYHESAWRVSPLDPAAVLTPAHYVGLARTAERGVLDSIFLPDSPGVAEFRSEYLPGAGLDPVQLLGAVAMATERIGLIATVSTTYSHPWDVARRLATLDHLSGGRAGWNIVTTVEPAAAGNFGDRPHPPTPERYARADEFVEVVLKLWDAWEDDAAPMSKQTGVWADPAKLHPPRHQGTHFHVSGYLPFPRSPQGHPFLTQAGSSPAGVALAAKYADAVFTPQSDPADSRAFRQSLRAQAAAAGRDPDHIKVLPGLSYLLAGTDAEAQALRLRLEQAASGEFRWRNLANLAGLDYRRLDPDAPFPAALLDSAPKTSFGASIYRMAAERPQSLREVAQRLSALPGGLDFTGTPQAMADLITTWWQAGAADGFTIMPNVLPDQLELFVEHVVPILQRRGIARTEYRGRTLRDHVGLPRPAASHAGGK
ncbi:NtaA/DmoA family FMN-dependent monooxygenase [Actinocrinis puniceicyclus]|uniref:NtaA/DmoA family FMN-dependent monooxygenase n=1 Tax=Actinocrinis puniceicyclus TaxID=977794 RepID=A0A8J8BEN5_9ACTN|nr:NtaA/DmoA family FMN-dependent monooxygenase [Actinocrinis puniceicyclus]MBS2965346.1 NtaA/DmoA family FMN-dependent monooxygenase [Actinocrinis puniceicyclus]